MPTSEYDIAEVSGQDIFRLLPNTIRTRDPGVLASLCEAIASERNYLARLVRILVQSNNPYEAGRFNPEQWGETAESLAAAIEAGSPEPSPVSYHLEEVQELLLDRLSENLGNRLEGVDRESLRRCIASAIQRYKVRGSGYAISVSSQLGSVGESVSEDRWSNLSGTKLVRSPEVYPMVGANQFPVGDQSYDPNSFDGTPESYEYSNPSFFPDESGQFLGNLMEGNPFVTISGVVSYLNPGKYLLSGGSTSSRATVQIPHLDKTVVTPSTFTATFPGDWGNMVAVEVLYLNGEFVVKVSGPGTKVKYKTSRHQITHFVHLMLAAYAGIESEVDDKVVDLWQATGHMERTMRSEELIPLTRTPLEPTGLAAGVQDRVLYAISKPIRNPVLQSVSKYWSMVVIGPDSGEWIEQLPRDNNPIGDGVTLLTEGGDLLSTETATTIDVTQIIQQDEVDGKWYRWVVSDDGELSFVETNSADSSSLVTFQDRYAWVSGGILRITVEPPPLGSFDVPYGPYDVPPESMEDWYGPDAIKPTEDWLVRDRPEDFLTNDSGSGNMSDHAGHYSEDSGVYESTGDIRHRLVGVTGGLMGPFAPYPADPMVFLLNGHGNYVWRDRTTNQPILTRWKGDGTMEHTILEVDGPIEGAEVAGLDPDGFLVSPTDLIADSPHGNLNQIYRPLIRFVPADSIEYGGDLKIDDDWSVGEVLYVGAPYNSLATTDAFGATALSYAGQPAFYCRKVAEAALPSAGEVSVRLELESISSGFVVVVAHCDTDRNLTVLGQVQVNLGVVTGTFTVPSAGSVIVLHSGQATGECFIEWETAELAGVETFSSDRDLVIVASAYHWDNVVSSLSSLGATVSADQAEIIKETFVELEDAGLLNKFKVLHMPIWGVAAANALDWITLLSGTWNGPGSSVTHGAGWVQSDGVVGSFTVAQNQNVIWSSPNVNGLFFGGYTANSISGLSGYIGNRDGSLNGVQLWHTTDTDLAFDSPNNTKRTSGSVNKNGGTLIASRIGTSVHVGRRYGNVYTSLANTTVTDGGTIPAISLFALRGHAHFCTNKCSYFGAIENANAADCELITSILESSWEALTGLTMP